MPVNALVRMSLEGVDGNIYGVLGAFEREARNQGWSQAEISDVRERVFSSESYEEALSTILENIELV